MKTIYDFEILDILGEPLDWGLFRGKKILLFNTASECGFTSQLASIEILYRDFKNHDFEIIGVPSNDFGGQEPGSSEEILSFCQREYEVSFTLTEKMSILGENAHPMYKWLQKKELNGMADQPVTWNFQKFGIDYMGRIARVFSPATDPFHSSIGSWITQAELL